MKLLLFDLDGTLLRSTRGAEPFHVAMRETFGVDIEPSAMRFDGKTDPLIVAELLERAGCDGPCETEALRSFEVRLGELLEDALARGTTRVDAIDGVRTTLEGLAGDQRFALAVLTGNFARTARLKLTAAGLAGYFEVGAYGSDAAERAALPEIARERFRLHTGKTVPLADCVIIGDTPLDHRAAEANGMPCVLVATGRTPIDDLSGLGAAAVFPDWSDPAAIHAALRAL